MNFILHYPLAKPHNMMDAFLFFFISYRYDLEYILSAE